MEQILIIALTLCLIAVYGFIWYFILKWKNKRHKKALSETAVPFSDSYRVNKIDVISTLIISIVLITISLVLVITSLFVN